MPSDPPRLDRRDFLGVAGGAALICTVGGQQVTVRDAADVTEADAAAASIPRPRAAARDRLDSARFATPSPQPGGREREYWVSARAVRWRVAHRVRRDEWMRRALPRRRFTAFVYQRYTAGFAAPIGTPRIPGPTLYAEVGDTIKVHFRNPGGRIGQALTMHPHGVRYTPDYDGSYLEAFTRAGGFVGAGEEFTYVWEATPDSVGIWPYHDHGPNHTLNTFRGLFGAVVVRPKGERPPDVENLLYMHSFPPQVSGMDDVIHCVNGRTGAGNTPTIRARVGQRVAMHVIGGDNNFHTFHLHGHWWRNAAGAFVDTPSVGPKESITAAWQEDNPGRWLYHCHVFAHQDAGMAGWYLVDP